MIFKSLSQYAMLLLLALSTLAATTGCNDDDEVDSQDRFEVDGTEFQITSANYTNLGDNGDGTFTGQISFLTDGTSIDANGEAVGSGTVLSFLIVSNSSTLEARTYTVNADPSGGGAGTYSALASAISTSSDFASGNVTNQFLTSGSLSVSMDNDNFEIDFDGQAVSGLSFVDVELEFEGPVQ